MDNGKDHVTRNEYEQGMGEQVANIIDAMNAINEMKKVINVHAEVLGCHRYILEKFVPRPLLEQAAKDYKTEREQLISAEAALARGEGN